MRSYVPGENVYEYDYETFKEDFDYGSYAEVEPVPIDESVQVQFDPRPNKTQGEIKSFVRNSFQKYLDEKNDGISLKIKFQPDAEDLAKFHGTSNETQAEPVVQEPTPEKVELPKSEATPKKTSNEPPTISKFIIIGAMKCGTTAINNFLRFHPGAVPTGELYFFLKAYQQNKTQEEFYEEYLNLMPGNSRTLKCQTKTSSVKNFINNLKISLL